MIPIFPMCDCISLFNSPSLYASSMHHFGFTSFFKSPNYANCWIPISNARSLSIFCTRNRGAVPFDSDEPEYDDLVFRLLEKGKVRGDEPRIDDPAAKTGIDDEREDLSFGENFEFKGQMTDYKLVNEDDIVDPHEPRFKLEESEQSHCRGTVEVGKNRKQMVRRSSVMAKQVISINSALSLGFISQLWVDTSSWVVTIVELRPNLLSSCAERFLLKEIKRVGDVVLVGDENVIQDGFKLVGLETLVGYTVITPSGRHFGKVRGFTFDIVCGAVESLELDAFGISIIPSSLVSTYALYVEDVVEVLPDTVVVRAAAVSHIKRLTKGLWNGQKAGNLNDELREELDDNEEQDRRRKRLSRQKFRARIIRSGDEWELPMDYL